MKNTELPRNQEDYTDMKIWKKIITKYILFTPHELVKFLEKKKKRAAVLIIDDANIMFNSGLFFENQKLYFSLIGVFATIRTKVSNLIVTAVDPLELVKPFKTNV
jgi:hypothetical protein